LGARGERKKGRKKGGGEGRMAEMWMVPGWSCNLPREKKGKEGGRGEGGKGEYGNENVPAKFFVDRAIFPIRKKERKRREKETDRFLRLPEKKGKRKGKRGGGEVGAFFNPSSESRRKKKGGIVGRPRGCHGRSLVFVSFPPKEKKRGKGRKKSGGNTGQTRTRPFILLEKGRKRRERK